MSGEPVGIPETPEELAEFAKGRIHEACVAALASCAAEEWDAALGLVDELIAAGPGGAQAGRLQLLRSAALSKAGRHEEALGAANAALEQGQRNARGWCAKAGVLMALGDHQGALGCCKKAGELASRGERAGVLEQEAAALGALRRHEEAYRVATRALELNPGGIGMRVVRAAALRSSGRHREAVAEMDDLVGRWPNKPALRLTRASFLMDAGMYEEMIEEVEPFTKGPKASGAMWYNKARALALLGRHDEALDALTVAVALEPGIRGESKGKEDFGPSRETARFRRLMGKA